MPVNPRLLAAPVLLIITLLWIFMAFMGRPTPAFSGS